MKTPTALRLFQANLLATDCLLELADLQHLLCGPWSSRGCRSTLESLAELFPDAVADFREVCLYFVAASSSPCVVGNHPYHCAHDATMDLAGRALAAHKQQDRGDLKDALSFLRDVDLEHLETQMTAEFIRAGVMLELAANSGESEESSAKRLVEVPPRHVEGDRAFWALDVPLATEPDVDDLPWLFSDDCKACTWGEKQFVFTAQQAVACSELWNAHQAGLPGVSAATILETIADRLESSRARSVSEVFCKRDRGKKKMHEAWGTMIVSPHKGFYRLVPPE